MTLIPDIAAQTTQAGDRRKIVTLLLIAYTVRAISIIGKRENLPQDDAKRTRAILRSIRDTNVPMWIVLVAILSIASDFESTRSIAVAFALLITVAVILNNGLEAIDAIQSYTEPRSKPRSEPSKEAPNDRR